MKLFKIILLLAIASVAQAQTKAVNVNRVSASCTPDTAIYASGDAVCDAMTFSGILNSSMKGFIIEATIEDTENLASAYDIKCKPSPFLGTVTANNPFDPTDDELPLLTGVSLLTTDQYVYSDNGETSISGTRNYVFSETPTTGSPTRGNLYCALITRSTPDWASSQTITLTLTVESLQ